MDPKPYFKLWLWIVERMREPSTWRGLVLLATAFGVKVSPEMSEQVIAAGLALAGLMGAATKDGEGK